MISPARTTIDTDGKNQKQCKPIPSLSPFSFNLDSCSRRPDFTKSTTKKERTLKAACFAASGPQLIYLNTVVS